MSEMLRVFIGYDPRQPVSYQVLHHSIVTRASRPVAITPLIIEQLPLKRVGLTPFTFSRFMAPYLCDYAGKSVFLDADMLCLGDIAELFDMVEGHHAVGVCKSKMRFEWASLMVFNNRNCDALTPAYIEEARDLHGIGWCEADEIASVPLEWNHLVGYDEVTGETPKLVHYTQGVPCFPETEDCAYAKEWLEEADKCMSAMPWQKIMGNSVHAKYVYDRLWRSGKRDLIPPHLIKTGEAAVARPAD